MKKTILLLTLGFTSFFSLIACPIYYKGKVFIVNEQMEILKDVEFWQMNNQEDSFQRTTKNHYRRNTDSISYQFYTSGGWGWDWEDDEKAASKYKYRIKAKGYADLTVSHIKFNRCSWGDSNCTNPVLYLVMQTHKFVTNGNKVERIESYQIKKSIVATDTTIFKPKLTNKSSLGNSEVSSLISTYPNPFTEEIHLNLPKKPLGVYHYTVYTIMGKELIKGSVTQQKSVIKMNALKPGKYIFQLTDEKGNISYLNKVIKISS